MIKVNINCFNDNFLVFHFRIKFMNNRHYTNKNLFNRLTKRSVYIRITFKDCVYFKVHFLIFENYRNCVIVFKKFRIILLVWLLFNKTRRRLYFWKILRFIIKIIRRLLLLMIMFYYKIFYVKVIFLYTHNRH